METGELKLAKTLYDSDDRFRTVCAHAAIGLAVTTLDGHYLEVNPCYCEITGYSQDELLSTNRSALIHPQDVKRFQNSLRKLQSGEIPAFVIEKRYVRKDGSIVWVKNSVSMVSDSRGRPEIIVTLCEDISERKRADEALRESEQRLAMELVALGQLHEFSTRLLISPDLPTALDEILDAVIAMQGADMGNVQVFDRQTGQLRIVAQQGFRREFLEYFDTVRVGDDSACSRAMKSGKRVVIEDVMTDPAYLSHHPIAAAAGYRAVQSTPLTSRSGELLGMFCTHFPYPHRPSERDLRMLDLYARQAADVIERIRAEETLREADQRKDEFLAMLAHELRNPLAPLRNALQILQLTEQNQHVTPPVREMMERQVQQLVRLVDDLLDVSRITRGKIELRKELLDLADVIRTALEISQPLIETARHELAVSPPAEPLFIEGDLTRLAQVLSNLINNAAKYTPAGGRIWVGVVTEGSDAVIRVRDNGIGIPAEMLPRIFEIFVQVDRSVARAQGGLGIGLTLARRLAEMHGGSIEACSAGLNQGSEFIVRLPLARDPRRPVGFHEKPADGTDAATNKARRILVVDDNVDSAKSLAMLLKLMGHDVRTAHEGTSALREAAAFVPEVVLLDIGMPGIDGYEVARRMKALPQLQQTVLVAQTGWGQEQDRRRSEEAGFHRHLVKPVNPKALQDLLGRMKP